MGEWESGREKAMPEPEGMPIRLVKNVLIPMADGVELAADLFLP